MIYRLGKIEVDPANFLLTVDGETTPVEPLVFDLIVCLIENRDRLVSRQELFETIWPGRIPSDSSLGNHIKSARQALGDDGHEQRVIKTVHGRGYRFIAEVEELAGDPSVEQCVPAGDQRSEQLAQRPSRGRLAIYAISVMLLVAVGSFVWLQEPDVAVESIAVLPLKNLSDDPEQQYFVEGMQDALIGRLARITDLRVISRTSTLRYGTTEKSVPEIARELNVNAIVEGSVLRDNDRVRITAQLIRGDSDEHLWAESYDRDIDHVLPLINEISIAIANEIEVAVKPDQQEMRPQIEVVDVRLHELVLKGRQSFDTFRFNDSLQYFQQAAALDPEFAPAHAGVAGSYFVMEFMGWAPDIDGIQLAREAALKALALDNNSSEGYSVLGGIQLYFDWDWESARRNLLRAVNLYPNDALTRHGYADYLMVIGDLEESLKQVEIGLLYDPYSPMARGVVEFHRLALHQYDTVIENCRQAREEWPDNLLISLPCQEALWLKGLQEEGLAEYKKTWGRDEELLKALEKGYSESGYDGALLALAKTLEGRVPGFNDYVALAHLYARAGEPDLALTWLEQSYERRQPQILHIKAMPVFEELHADPRFQDLLRRVGFPE